MGAEGFALALAGGATGGHLLPGLHLLESFRADGDRPPAEPLGDALWFLAGRPVETDALYGLEAGLAGVSCERVTLKLEPPGGGAPSLARLARRLLPETLVARRALRAHASRVLVGLGGFTSAPAVLAARSLGIPVALLEVNATEGKATRRLAPLARLVLHAWKTSLPEPPSARHVWIGPPLSPRAFAAAGERERAPELRAELGLEAERPLLLVLGGSQGAASLNRFCREHGAGLTAAGVAILHQTGPGRLDEAGSPERLGPLYRPVEFVRDVPRHLRAATFALSRGGASTLAEIAAACCPAMIVPYPHHRDRHQEKNARQLGEGVLITDEASLDAAACERLIELCSGAAADRRERMAERLRTSIPQDGALRLREAVLELGRSHKARPDSPVEH